MTLESELRMKILELFYASSICRRTKLIKKNF